MLQANVVHSSEVVIFYRVASILACIEAMLKVAMIVILTEYI